MLSELEGAILLEIKLRNRKTAFQVRKAFEQSPTTDWSGSSGAIYPAIARLQRGGIISYGEARDKRGTRLLAVTKKGTDAMHEWATDPNLAASLGADPFRTRVDYLNALPARQKKAALEKVRGALLKALLVIEEKTVTDKLAKEEANLLASQLLDSRLEWIDKRSKRNN